MSPINNAFSVVSIISAILVSIPFYWHFKALNAGTCLFILWTAIPCLILFIDSVVWNGNTGDWAPVWCDITTRILVGATVAIPAVSLCISRRIYYTATSGSVPTIADKRRAVWIDLSIGLLIPIIEMGLQFIVEGHRFDIFEDLGCRAFTFNTLPTYFIVFAPTLVLGLVSAVYCTLNIKYFIHKRHILRTVLGSKLSSNNHSQSSNRYIRLICLATIDIVFSVPFSIFTIYVSSQGDIAPWISVANTHFGFSRVDQIPAFFWRAGSTAFALEIDRWIFPFLALVFFGFFGFSEEASERYKELRKWAEEKYAVLRRKNATPGSGFRNIDVPKLDFKVRFKLARKEKAGSDSGLPIFQKAAALRDIPDTPDLLSFQDVGGLLGGDVKSPFTQGSATSIINPSWRSDRSDSHLPSRSRSDSPMLFRPRDLDYPTPDSESVHSANSTIFAASPISPPGLMSPVVMTQINDSKALPSLPTPPEPVLPISRPSPQLSISIPKPLQRSISRNLSTSSKHSTCPSSAIGSPMPFSVFLARNLASKKNRSPSVGTGEISMHSSNTRSLSMKSKSKTSKNPRTPSLSVSIPQTMASSPSKYSQFTTEQDAISISSNVSGFESFLEISSPPQASAPVRF